MSKQNVEQVKCDRCPASYYRSEGTTIQDVDKPPVSETKGSLDLGYSEEGGGEINVNLEDMCPRCRAEVKAAIRFIEKSDRAGDWSAEEPEHVRLSLYVAGPLGVLASPQVASDGAQPKKTSVPMAEKSFPAAVIPATPVEAAADPVTPPVEKDAPDEVPADGKPAKRSRRSMAEMAEDDIKERISIAHEAEDGSKKLDWQASLEYQNTLTKKEQIAYARLFKEARVGKSDERPHFAPGDENSWGLIRRRLAAPQPVDEDDTEVNSTTDVPSPHVEDETTGPEDTAPIAVDSSEDGFF